MCLAVVVYNYPDEEDIQNVLEGLDNAWDDNPHGGGIAYADKGVIIIDKGYFDKGAFLARVEDTLRAEYDSDVLIHLRYASAGELGEENCHPFSIGKEQAFIHNGTISQMKAKINDKKSDTQLFGEFLTGLPADFTEHKGYTELLEDYLGFNKVAVINTFGSSTIFNEDLGENVGSIWYSNDYYKKAVVRKKPVTNSNYNNYCYDRYKEFCYSCGEMLYTQIEKDTCICESCMSSHSY